MQIGIDLGTTNSAMAYYTEDGDAEIIENSDGENTTPSAVLFEEVEDDDEDGNRVTVGEPALKKRALRPERTFTRTKQDMGDDVTYEVDGEEITPQQIAAYVLKRLKSDAESALGESVDSAIITVPYYFGEKAREATKTAARAAGLEPETVLNEPTAACLAYRHDNDIGGKLLVYDLGGGTFDATLVEARDTKNEVIATEGDKDLGGENFDDELYDYVCGNLVDDGYPDPDDNPYKKANLRTELRDAKEQLSSRPEVTFGFDTGEGMAEIELTEEEFNDVTGHLVEETIESIETLFEEQDTDADDIDHVIMVGGSTRINLVQERVEEFFGMAPSVDANPDEIVARGAAMHTAYYREGVPTDALPAPMTDVLSHSLGVETASGKNSKILEKHETIPDDDTRMYTNPEDDIPNITVRILQGEAEMADDDGVEELGEFELEGITPQPAGEAEIEVTFNVGPDGTLTAEAKELDSGTEGEITIEDNIGLTKEEIQDIQEEVADDTPEWSRPEEA